jgi:TonB family protein
MNTSSGRVGTPEPRVAIPSFADGCVRGALGCGDPMSQGAVLRTLSGGRAKMRACYDAALVKAPALAGQLTLVFVVRPDGSVESVEEEGAFADPALARCVLAVVKKLKFFDPPAANVRIRYPVKFER